jgi:endonuclease/exonuclease/phosphatase family metal-dependent hydrolase
LTVNRLEKRSALLSLIDLGAFKIQCICTHLNLLKSDRIKQAKMLVNFIKSNEVEGVPIILGGDLNDQDGDTTKILVKEVGFSSPKAEQLYPTFPSFLPFLSLDRILCKNIDVVGSEIGKSSKYRTYSDHLPLFYTFKMSPK